MRGLIALWAAWILLLVLTLVAWLGLGRKLDHIEEEISQISGGPTIGPIIIIQPHPDPNGIAWAEWSIQTLGNLAVGGNSMELRTDVTWNKKIFKAKSNNQTKPVNIKSLTLALAGGHTVKVVLYNGKLKWSYDGNPLNDCDYDGTTGMSNPPECLNDGIPPEFFGELTLMSADPDGSGSTFDDAGIAVMQTEN